uniref:26S proteasome non-ATPase regulatory subunit 5 n=1 Tax=Ixodes ricinus TaxID=34613 RepID=V5GUA5_IXORI
MAADLKAVLTNLLGNLSRSRSPASLTEAKTILSATRIENIYNVSKDLDLSPLFSCLETFEGEDLEELNDLLGKLLDSFPPQTLLSAHKDHLVGALKSPSPSVRAVVLRQLIRCTKDNSTLSQLSHSKSVLESLLRLLGEEDLWASKQSALILREVAKEKEALSALLQPPVALILDNVMGRGDVFRFRVFEVFVDIAKASPEMLEKLAESGHLDKLLQETNQGDVLVRLNALELLTELASKSHGLDYLEKKGILAKLSSVTINVAKDPLGSLLGPGLLKFFGSMGQTSPQRLLVDYPQVLGFIFECVQDGDSASQAVAVETIGVIGSSVQGKRALQSHGDKMKQYLKTLSQNIQGGRSELRVRSLDALANILHIEDDSCEDIIRLTEQWYNAFGEAPTRLLLGVCKQPFPDLRCSALGVVCEVAHSPWGQAALASHPGFLEYLLDRSTESDKEGKEAKFAIVAALAQCPSQPRGFSSEDWQRIRTAHKEGPFYIAAEAAVAFEGSS